MSEPKNLNPLSIFTGFIPWIAFSLVAQRMAANGVAWSALLAAAIGLVFVVRGRRTGNPTMMDMYSLVLFSLIAVVGFVGGENIDNWLFEWGRPFVGVVLGLILLATASTRPFTAEYAKRSTPQEYWSSPLFRRINFVLSATWGVAITVMGAASVLVTALDAHATGTDSPYLIDFFLNWAVPIILIVVMVHVTNTYPDKASAQAAARLGDAA
ncbi:hypothetical protein [Rhodococcoides fascians]|uniref:hypothetical protein n=1 Tax=Rhodococcoides fascians TaxID=1828 RepID=UPI00056C6F2D|nr:hypothetical protein [Rhodococcus fascians]